LSGLKNESLYFSNEIYLEREREGEGEREREKADIWINGANDKN